MSTFRRQQYIHRLPVLTSAYDTHKDLNTEAPNLFQHTASFTPEISKDDLTTLGSRLPLLRPLLLNLTKGLPFEFPSEVNTYRCIFPECTESISAETFIRNLSLILDLATAEQISPRAETRLTNYLKQMFCHRHGSYEKDDQAREFAGEAMATAKAENIFRHLDAEAECLVKELTSTINSTSKDDIETLTTFYTFPPLFRPLFCSLLSNLPIDLEVSYPRPADENASYRCIFPDCKTWTLIPYSADPFFRSLAQIIELATSDDQVLRTGKAEVLIAANLEQILCHQHDEAEKKTRAKEIAKDCVPIIKKWRDGISAISTTRSANNTAVRSHGAIAPNDSSKTASAHNSPGPSRTKISDILPETLIRLHGNGIEPYFTEIEQLKQPTNLQEKSLAAMQAADFGTNDPYDPASDTNSTIGSPPASQGVPTQEAQTATPTANTPKAKQPTSSFIRHQEAALQRIVEQQSQKIERLLEENHRLREEAKSFNEEYMNGH